MVCCAAAALVFGVVLRLFKGRKATTPPRPTTTANPVESPIKERT